VGYTAHMINKLKSIFNSALAQAGSAEDDGHALERAAAALMIEMSRADHHVDEREQALITNALTDVFQLERAEVDELLAGADTNADEATSLYEFTSILNSRFEHEQKVQFVEQLWRIAYADGELEKHEAHLVRKVADLLHLRHREYIDGKLRAESDV
jgi:uncharacterized tellurite resistance protein B-like protein